MNTSKLMIAVLGAAALFAGCASSTPKEPTTAEAAAAGHQHGKGMMAACPMQLSGTTVAASEVDGGVAMAFTTSTENLAELRQRVRSMAEMHNQHHAQGGVVAGGESPSGAPTEGHGLHGGMMMGGRMPASTARVEETENGARLVFEPKEGGELDALRRHVQMRAERMSTGQCPMMQPQAEAAS